MKYRFAYSMLLASSLLLVAHPGQAQTSLAPTPPPDSARLREAAAFPDPTDEDEDAEEAADAAGSKGKRGPAAPCCEKRPFRLTPRYTWDVNVDGRFFLPAYTTNYFYNTYYYGPGGALGLYDQSASAGRFTSFLVRRNTSVRRPGRGQGVRKGAYRYGLALGTSLSAVRPDTAFAQNTGLTAYGIYTAAQFNTTSARFGYERQETIGRFQLLYGYEVGATHTWQNQRLRTYYVQEHREETTNFWQRNFTVVVAALAGVRYYLHPRVSLALEASYQLYYGRQQQGGIAPAIYNGNYYTGKAGTRGWSFGQNLLPFNAFYLAFHFGKPVRVKA